MHVLRNALLAAQAALALATTKAARLDTEAQAALLGGNIAAYRELAAQARAAYAEKRRQAALVDANGKASTLQHEETIGGLAWSRRP
jgi:hypothetical protein